MQHTQSALQVDTMQLRELINNIPGATAVYSGKDMHIVFANKAMIGFWGKDDSVIGKRLIDALPEIEGQPFMELLQNVITNGESVAFKEAPAVLRVNGELQTFYFDFTYSPLKNSDGEVEAVINSATDVTELVRARKELEKALEQTELAKQAAELGMFDYDLITNNLVWDARCRELFGIDHDGPVSYEDDFVKNLHEEDRQRVVKVIENVFNKALTNGEYDIEYRTVGVVDKRVRWVRAKGKVFFNDEDKAVRFVGSVIDVTEQVAARKELERAEEQLRTAIDSAEMGTWFIDVNTMHLTTSARLNELFGFNPDEKISLDMAISHINEQHRERVVAAINLAISSGEPYDIEYPTMGFKDGKTRWVRATGKLYKSEQGEPLHFSGTALDITERKENEQRKDDFISIASHELKTPVTTLKASIQLLNRMKDDLPSPAMQRLVEQSNKSMQKVSALIEDLLNVTRMNQGQLHLNKTVFTTAELLAECCNNVREDGAYTLDIKGDMNLSIFADRHRIDQVLVNLVNNAVKYAHQSYTIILQAEKVGNKAKISVTDAGPGIAPDKQPYLFDRYYRADHKGNQFSGLGLGLYISAEIVKRHNGEIGVVSELGKGSTFWFTLPLSN